MLSQGDVEACMINIFFFIIFSRRLATPSLRKQTSWKWLWGSSATFPLLTLKVSSGSAGLKTFIVI